MSENRQWTPGFKVSDRAGLRLDTLLEIEELVAEHTTLEDMVRWRCAQRPPAPVFREIVIQDEFTLDVVVPLALEGCEENDLHLAYDATCSGALGGVTVWNHAPKRTELLAARLESGWSPTASPMRDGARVLGYAAEGEKTDRAA
ncbi:hypothetical protein ACFL59_03580 [Planctomycetota bacterium]